MEFCPFLSELNLSSSWSEYFCISIFCGSLQMNLFSQLSYPIMAISCPTIDPSCFLMTKVLKPERPSDNFVFNSDKDTG